MDQTIVQSPGMVLVGLSFFGDPFRVSGGWSEENEIGRLWSRFMSFLEKNRTSIKHVKNERYAYELHVPHETTDTTGEYEVFVGIEVERAEAPPVELSVKVLPATSYAAFTLQGQEIVSDWHKVISEQWMPDSGYETAAGYSFQRYDERFKGVQQIDESVLEVFIPVRPRRGPQ
jgi:predicted transcriptional regulator YdeE